MHLDSLPSRPLQGVRIDKHANRKAPVINRLNVQLVHEVDDLVDCFSRAGFAEVHCPRRLSHHACVLVSKLFNFNICHLIIGVFAFGEDVLPFVTLRASAEVNRVMGHHHRKGAAQSGLPYSLLKAWQPRHGRGLG